MAFPIPLVFALLLFALSAQSSPIRSQSRGSSVALSASYNNLKLPSSTLPPPGPDLVLRYVALGVGTQNYTCSSPSASSTPVSIGARANLYDISRLNNDPLASEKLPYLPAQALYANMVGSWLLTAYLHAMGFDNQLGVHFFNETEVPYFSLPKAVPVPLVAFHGKKNGTMTAPVNSCRGTKGEGAVAWLQLIDLGDSTPLGDLKATYRVETAGGNPPTTCQGQPANIEVPYAAEYWIFGPRSAR